MAAEHQQNPSNGRMGSSGRRMAVSARKLAATLWELQEISLSSIALPGKVTNEACDNHLPETPGSRRNLAQLPFPPSPASSYVGMRALRRSSIKCRFGDSTKRKPPITGQATAAAQVQVLKLLENARRVNCPADDDEDTLEIKVDDGTTTAAPSFLNAKAVPSGISESTTSSELLKVLNRVWSLEEQHKSSISVVTALQSDLEGAQSRVEELTIQKISHSRDMENLNKKLADEKMEWQEMEQEKTRQSLQSIKEELEDEKKSKRKLDLLHRKVTKELIDVKKSLMKALQDLEREQKARELMEDVCDELAREVGEDKAKVEELKWESIKVREEVEEERKMLQVAEVWREERVQMKLAEARLEIEEKNTALDKLRTELDAFLKAKRASDAVHGGANCTKMYKDLKMSGIAVDLNETRLPKAVSPIEEANEVRAQHRSPGNSSLDVEIKVTIPSPGSDYGVVEDDDGIDDDDEDDLHSIELNKDSYVGRVEATQWGQINSIQQEREMDGIRSVDSGNSPVVERVTNQGSRQGPHRRNTSQVEAVKTIGESRDKLKMWNFELESPWRTNCKVEKGEVRNSNEESSFSIDAKEVDELKAGSKGERESSLAGDEPEGNIIVQAMEEERKLLGSNDDISNNAGGTTPCEITFLNLEAATSAIWSNQNMGSSRELKGISGFSPMKQCASPTRHWGHSLSSSDPGNLHPSRPAKASGVALKASKDKTVKGKPSEAKADTKQPWFRTGKGV